MPRLIWIDVAKGAGITLVVVSHVLARTDPGNWVTWFLFLFHMPLFFILSGFLQRPAGLNSLLRNKSRSLLVPYFAYLLLLAVPVFAYTAAFKPNDLGGLIFELAFGGELLKGIFGVFWFVTCLFVAQLLFGAILHRYQSALSSQAIACILFCVLVGCLISNMDLPTPLAAGISPFAVLFLWVGAVLREKGPQISIQFAIACAIISSIIIVGSFWIHLDITFDMKFGRYGPPILGALLAVALSLAFIWVCQVACTLPKIEMVGKFGQASMVIMFLHQAVQLTFYRFVTNPVALTLMALIVSLAAYFVFQSFALLRVAFLGMKPENRTATG